jgi:hypothetical protein
MYRCGRGRREVRVWPPLLRVGVIDCDMKFCSKKNCRYRETGVQGFDREILKLNVS